MKDFEMTFTINGKDVGIAFLGVENGKLHTEAAEEQFYAILRKNEKSLIEEAGEEEKGDIVDKLTPAQEEKIKETHAKDYHGTDDNMVDAYEDFLQGLTVEDLKAILV